MGYFAGFGGSVVISNSNGLPLSVNITSASGASVTVYSDAARTTAVTMPESISGSKTYYLAEDGGYVASTKLNGVEIGGQQGSAVTIDLRGGCTTTLVPSVDPRESAGVAATYARTVSVVAQRLLAGASTFGSDSATGATAPTITLSAAGAATSISGGVRVSPKRLSSTAIDSSSDPHFEFVGAIPGRYLVSSTDLAYANYLTGGTSQNARNHPRIKFNYTGQAFELYLRMRSTTFDYRLWVDGLPVTATLQTIAVATSSRYMLKLDFGSSGTRQIELEINDPEFGGVYIEPTGSITRPQRTGLLLAAFGDSHTRGANGVSYVDTWVRRAANQLRADWVNLGIGGSGYLNDNGTTGANYRNRLTTDVIPMNPDVLVFEGSWNDSSATEAALAAEAAYCFQTLKAALPTTLLVAAGPWVTTHILAPTLDAHDATLRAQAQAAGWHGYISYRDPLNLKGSTPAWAATTVYAVGDAVVANGLVQTCILAHTSTGTFDQTKWRSTAIVTGTGKVGTTTGDGSADVIVSNDGVHNTVLGHQVKARHVAAELARIAQAITSGASWAN